MLEKVVTLSATISLCLLFIILNLTSPTTIGPFGILAVFVLGYTSLIGLVTYIFYGMSRVIVAIGSAFTARKPLSSLSFRRSYYYSTLFSLSPIMLVGLQSVGSIGLYEVILVLIFTVIGTIYISKRIT